MHSAKWMGTPLVLALATLGCSSETEAGNATPELSIPATIRIGQGQTKDFGIAVSDADGDQVSVVITSSNPGLEAAIDEANTTLTLHASYQLSGPTTITADLSDANGASASVTRDVLVNPISWVGATSWTAQGPQAREHGAMVTASADGFALLMGGSGYSPYLQGLDDVWRYELATGVWSQITPTGDVPPPGGSRRAAQIPGTHTAYLFGGYGDGGSPSNADLYELDFSGGGAAFRSVPQQNAPPARALHAFVYDSVGDRFFLFGGASTVISNDTWVMTLQDGTAVWTELSLDPRPSPRYGFFYGFDDESGRLLIYSGAQGTSSVDPAQDTWVLDVRSEPPAWQLVLEGDAVPPGRRNGCMIFDPTGPRLFVFGGTADAATTEPGLWALDARAGREAWEQLMLEGEPEARSSGFGIFDAASERTLLGFGNTATSAFQDLNALGYAP